MTSSQDLGDKLRSHARTGEWLDLSDAPEPVVPADLIYAVLREEDPRHLRALKLRGAAVVGELDLEGMTLECSLQLDSCDLVDPVVLREAIAPRIRFHNCDVLSLHAEQLDIRGTLDLSRSSFREGVSLHGALIRGVLNLNGAKLGPDGSGVALVADGLTVKQDMFCRSLVEDPFEATAAVRLIGAEIGGQLCFDGASLAGNDGPSLIADGVRVHQAMFFQPAEGHRFTAEGEVRLIGAHVRDYLVLNGAVLDGGTGVALRADQLSVEKSMFCQRDGDDAFIARGMVRLNGAKIDGQLGFVGAEIETDAKTAINLSEARVSSLWFGLAESPPGVIDLRRAQIHTLYDRLYEEGGRAWLRAHLEGCVYQELVSPLGTTVTVEDRLEWLKEDPDGYSPQPYEQLATAYGRAGRDDDARRVAIAKQQRRRDTLGIRSKVSSYVLGATVAHGYRLTQAFIWLGGLLVIGTLLFGEVFSVGDSVATNADLTPAKTLSESASYQPLIYTLDVLVPVIDLGQQTSWRTHGTAQWVELLLASAGWILTVALVAGIVAKDK